MTDYISREAAIDALTEKNLAEHMDSVNDGLVASCHRSAQRIIANVPAADVRPVVHARPVKFFNNPWTGKMFTTCSACDGKISPKDNFCKHCGADMREERCDGT